MSRARRRDPLLAQSRLERWRRRLDRVLPATQEAAHEGPFLRRMWQRRRIGAGPVLVAFLAGWAVYSLVAGGHGLLTIASLERQRDRLHTEIAAVEAQISAVTEQLGDRGGDAFVAERTARERYGLARPGEVVYRFDAEAFGTGDAVATPSLAAISSLGALGAPPLDNAGTGE